MTKHVVSTLAADTRYAKWNTTSGVGSVERSVLVRGKAGVAVKGLEKPYTPLGVETTISDSDAQFLREHEMFKQHQENGFVKIVERTPDADSVAQKMSRDEGSRPRTPEDVKDFAKKKGDDTLQAVTNKK